MLLVLSVLYAVVESIRIYDARLIQAKTRDFDSGVAQDAKGMVLPAWVGYVHFAGWVLLAIIVILDWTFAIGLYAVLFVLRVAPVLERIGEMIMRPFLREESSNHMRSGGPPGVNQ
jgi:hypothetical protein